MRAADASGAHGSSRAREHAVRADIGLIDTRIRHHEAEAMRHDQDVLLVTYDFR